MRRARHPKKDVEKALSAAEVAGMHVRTKASGHAWGYLVCPCGDRMSVWSTPKNSGNFARKIDRFAARHDHGGGD